MTQFDKTVHLTFTDVTTEGQVTIHSFPLSPRIQSEIIQAKDFTGGNDFVLTHPRLVDFNQDHHTELLEYFLNEDKFHNFENQIIKESTVFGDRITLKQPDTYLESLYLNDLIFLAAILSNLNLKSRMITVVQTIINKYKLSFDEIKRRATTDKYSMTVYTK